MEREIGIDAAQAGDEMIFKCAYGTFGGVTTMIMRRDQLKINFLLLEVSFEFFRGFVV